MKKKEILIVAILAIVSVLAIGLMKSGIMNKPSAPASSAEVVQPDEPAPAGSETETAGGEEEKKPEEEKGPTDPALVTVDIYHGQTIIKSFNPSVDNVYHITGNYGTLDVEVVDGKWHVTNEECPNHICNGMGWMGPDDIIPISCLPNDVYVIVR